MRQNTQLTNTVHTNVMFWARALFCLVLRSSDPFVSGDFHTAAKKQSLHDKCYIIRLVICMKNFCQKNTGIKRDFWENTEGVRACGRVLGLLLIRFLRADIFCVLTKKQQAVQT